MPRSEMQSQVLLFSIICSEAEVRLREYNTWHPLYKVQDKRKERLVSFVMFFLRKLNHSELLPYYAGGEEVYSHFFLDTQDVSATAQK